MLCNNIVILSVKDCKKNNVLRKDLSPSMYFDTDWIEQADITLNIDTKSQQKIN